MPHWLRIALYIAGAVASWRWVFQPVRRGGSEAIRLLRHIRNNGDAIRELAALQRELAGSMVQLAVAIVGDLTAQRNDLNDLREQQRATAQLVVDVEVELRKLIRQVHGD